MRRIYSILEWLGIVMLAAILWVLIALQSARGAEPSQAKYAVVQIPSHGASATVIETGPGRTLILGCAHAYEGPSRDTPMNFEIPAVGVGQARKATIRLLAIDYKLDLSLVELGDGPLPYVAPVAPAGFRPGRQVLSIGFDEMKKPPHMDRASILGTSSTTTYTREIPWHGRSGGALLDLESGYLIGVVQGYETSGPRRGMYVSHEAVLRFLAQVQAPAPQFRSAPTPLPGRGLAPFCPPGGACPLPGGT